MISAVNASENITNDIVGMEETNNNVLSAKLNNQSINSIEYGNDFLSANPTGSFKDLANDIANAEGELKLTRNYVYDPNKDSNYKDGIVIDKEISINGRGFIINGDNNARAFYVSASDVVLRNLEFINCFSWGICFVKLNVRNSLY